MFFRSLFLRIRVLKHTHMLDQGEAGCSEYMNAILAQVIASYLLVSR
jgi:hypothetical protein